MDIFGTTNRRPKVYVNLCQGKRMVDTPKPYRSISHRAGNNCHATPSGVSSKGMDKAEVFGIDSDVKLGREIIRDGKGA
ncbi:predicted protein [Sclerotinia sclerotiorum 1980 UF-70]|uniref:Uncharacterized protein n=1 Tax=Sclerotinia sclerotiorum (strain ATCC 18683 / 1980 / Ss-1) TaxID=665079 RepID=A7EM22_SCLS1|nr:predicted protein [Sclerotinia sclerotiorum 1980 UF-70]EDO03888.1 predicted protein [Sclerotinia sclerotiorum 1980 UF-70]